MTRFFTFILAVMMMAGVFNVAVASRPAFLILATAARGQFRALLLVFKATTRPEPFSSIRVNDAFTS